MNRMPDSWDYLIVTASNDTQAKAYELQLDLRQKMGHLTHVRHALVVADPEGKRIGSGGSTLYCLSLIVNRELAESKGSASAEEILRGLRILIIHAGGDSKRLPAYGPCGKIFVPVPGESQSALGTTLFDRIAPAFMALPAGVPGAGQVVVTSGDALIRFDASAIRFTQPGMTALGCFATPEEASRHGVFCPGDHGAVRVYLQKPTLQEQTDAGAINRYGKTALDVGVMSFDAATAAAFLRTFQLNATPSGEMPWTGAMKENVLALGIDLYREISCAMGTEATLEQYVHSARASGSKWDDTALEGFYTTLRELPLYVQLLPQCGFLHFGSTRQLVSSGLALIQQDKGAAPDVTCLMVDNEIKTGGEVAGANSWVEGCSISARLTLAGGNVLVGADVNRPLSLPAEACIDVLSGKDNKGNDAWFVRCYGARDAFKDLIADGALFCGKPVLEWLSAAGATPEEIWDSAIPAGKCTLWDARVFPAVRAHDEYHDWLWMFDVSSATIEQKRAFLAADRYSAAEIALLTDQDAFHDAARSHSRGSDPALAAAPVQPG